MKLIQTLLFSISLTLFSLLAYGAESPDRAAQPVNINSATAEQLAVALDGVGMSKAMAIVEHRKRYGEFKQVESLESVKGIGKGTVEKNRSKIKIR